LEAVVFIVIFVFIIIYFIIFFKFSDSVVLI